MTLNLSIVAFSVNQSQKEDLVAKAEQDVEEEERRRIKREEQLEKERTERLARLDEWKVCNEHFKFKV